MLTTIQLLDLARERAGISSDYRLAQVVGVSKQSMTHYRTGRSSPDERASRRLAELAELDPELVAVWMQVERARDDEARVTWRAVAERLAKSATVGLVAMVGVSITPDAGAHIRVLETPIQSPADAGNGPAHLYYVNLRRSIRRLTQKVCNVFSGLFPPLQTLPAFDQVAS